GAAAGGDVCDVAGAAGFLELSDRVAAADDRVRARIRDRVRDRHGAGGEALPFEDAHRAVPEDRLRRLDACAVPLARLRPNVEAHHAGGDVDAVDDDGI